MKYMLHNIKMARIGLISTLFLSFAFASFASAQSLGSPNPVKYIVTPEVPQPGETVRIVIQGVGTFLGDSNITWQVDGKTITSGIGLQEFSFTAGALGINTTVRATIDSPSKGTIVKTFSFSPSVINMLWEADTSVPPFYKGKALYTAGSNLTVTALPQIISGGKTVSSGILSFQWQRNGKPIPTQSGRGKNQITFAGDQLLPAENVSVDVYSGATLVGSGSVTIPASKPQVALYVRDPLRGVLYDVTLGSTVTLSETEFTVKAEPYYFAKQSIAAGSVPFEWKLNGQETEGPQTAQGLLTLRQSGAGAGRATLEVSMQNTDSTRYVQSAKAAIQILFGGASNSAFSSFFGL